MIERVARTASTNSDLLERLRRWPAETAFAPVLRVAEMQSAGRGRQGRPWHGEAGAALTFSLAWPSSRDDLSGLSLAVGVALAQALDGETPPRLGLKWPNDLVLADARGLRKLGGILIETAPLSSRRVAVIGIGINVLPAPAVAQVARATGCMRELDADATVESTLQQLVEPLLASLRRFDRDGWPAFAPAFAERDLLRGRRVGAVVAGRMIEGVATGVSARGELLVATGESTCAVGSGEVTLLRVDEGDRTATGRSDLRSVGARTC